MAGQPLFQPLLPSKLSQDADLAPDSSFSPQGEGSQVRFQLAPAWLNQGGPRCPLTRLGSLLSGHDP